MIQQGQKRIGGQNISPLVYQNQTEDAIVPYLASVGGNRSNPFPINASNETDNTLDNVIPLALNQKNVEKRQPVQQISETSPDPASKIIDTALSLGKAGKTIYGAVNPISKKPVEIVESPLSGPIEEASGETVDSSIEGEQDTSTISSGETSVDIPTDTYAGEPTIVGDSTPDIAYNDGTDFTNSSYEEGGAGDGDGGSGYEGMATGAMLGGVTAALKGGDTQDIAVGTAIPVARNLATEYGSKAAANTLGGSVSNYVPIIGGAIGGGMAAINGGSTGQIVDSGIQGVSPWTAAAAAIRNYGVGAFDGGSSAGDVDALESNFYKAQDNQGRQWGAAINAGTTGWASEGYQDLTNEWGENVYEAVGPWGAQVIDPVGAVASGDSVEEVVSAPAEAIMQVFDDCTLFCYLYGRKSKQVRYAKVFCFRFMSEGMLLGYYQTARATVKHLEKHPKRKWIAERLADVFYRGMRWKLGREKNVPLSHKVVMSGMLNLFSIVYKITTAFNLSQFIPFRTCLPIIRKRDKSREVA